MQSLLQDLRYGWRLMWRSPGIHARGRRHARARHRRELRHLQHPQRAVAEAAAVPRSVARRVRLGWDVEEGEMRFNLRQADFVDLQRQAQSFESMAAYRYLSANLTGGDIPSACRRIASPPTRFDMLGVPAALGRIFDGRGRRRTPRSP